MDTIRTMQDDLKKASQSPKDVASAFQSSVKATSSVTTPAPVEANTNRPVPPPFPSRPSFSPPSPPPVKPSVVSSRTEPSEVPGNLPVADLPREGSSRPSVPVPPYRANVSTRSLASATLPVPSPSLSVTKELPEMKSAEVIVTKRPLAPIVPPPLPKAEVSVEPETSRSRGSILKFALTGVVILLLAGGGAFAYFQFFNKPKVDDPPIGIEDPIIPPTLIPVANTIEVSLQSEENLGDLLKGRIGSLGLEKGSFNRIVVKDETSVLSFDAFVSQIGLSIPEQPKTILTGEYTFFVYTQEEGIRYGLVLKTNSDIASAMTMWEPTMFEDLNSLFIGSNPQSVSAQFSDNKNYTSAIRYLNLPDPATSLDYSFSKDLLVITTSKDSMIDAIAKL